eukprot:378716-Karenia_brevis.AAC.1
MHGFGRKSGDDEHQHQASAMAPPKSNSITNESKASHFRNHWRLKRTSSSLSDDDDDDDDPDDAADDDDDDDDDGDGDGD